MAKFDYYPDPDTLAELHAKADELEAASLAEQEQLEAGWDYSTAIAQGIDSIVDATDLGEPRVKRINRFGMGVRITSEGSTGWQPTPMPGQPTTAQLELRARTMRTATFYPLDMDDTEWAQATAIQLRYRNRDAATDQQTISTVFRRKLDLAPLITLNTPFSPDQTISLLGSNDLKTNGELKKHYRQLIRPLMLSMGLEPPKDAVGYDIQAGRDAMRQWSTDAYDNKSAEVEKIVAAEQAYRQGLLNRAQPR